ncbi:C-_U-editing enzyme APOBEC-2b [Cyprinodon tularosa]|uniref:Apolipoprotein B mRNA editing enzyme, catalytic polypeptide-like 2b n=1 Tax=Cyprinodon variegatus TaxID=28743 RepID=A0A3Q2CWL4_CYPVA|nr:PREDICTED: C->U-editing enzyme APOBEC-2 [Cyprinodon variegatus]XP_038143274.1 C->U-editing enzyme APOBEC-2b [Cyprinodon tularosa]
MADRTNRLGVRRKEKTQETKANEEKDKEKVKEKAVKNTDKVAKKLEKTPEPHKTDEKKTNGESEGAAGADANNSEDNGDFQPIELPPFEIVTGERMSPFYFKFQFRNVEYSSGRNKTFLCFRVDTPGGSAEPLKGYLEDEHATAHAEEAFFQQVLPNSSKEYDVTWYVSSSPCAGCAAKLANILQQRKKLRLSIFCSRLFEWEEPEIVEGLKALVQAGCKLRMMKPIDFLHVWEMYVEQEGEVFTPWEDCQENYEYYVERLSDILK